MLNKEDRDKIENEYGTLLDHCAYSGAGIIIVIIKCPNVAGIELIILNNNCDRIPMKEYRNNGRNAATLNPVCLFFPFEVRTKFNYVVGANDLITIYGGNMSDILLVLSKDHKYAIKTTKDSLINFAIEAIKQLPE